MMYETRTLVSKATVYAITAMIFVAVVFGRLIKMTFQQVRSRNGFRWSNLWK